MYLYIHNGNLTEGNVKALSFTSKG